MTMSIEDVPGVETPQKLRFFVMEGEVDKESFLFATDYVSLFNLIQEIESGRKQMKIIGLYKEVSSMNEAFVYTDTIM